MWDVSGEIELLERCASECELISDLTTDPRGRRDNEALAAEYRQMARELKSLLHIA
jgi:hypothetical protein